ncbi:UNVERIFIED_CONTAM: Bet1-like protein [Sesamum calycinum]|uniref:Bet1-like protein n=1 Tax=Sesamum calycinum TaxID=2727403 RepID=A0AAW2NF00_9LAMI
MADPYRSREGLSTRSSAASGGGRDEVQVRIDPDFDDEVTGLRKQVRRLRDVAQDIETEAKSQNDFLNQLQMTLIKAQAGVKNNMRRLNKSIIREGSSHVMHVVLFALLLFFVVYYMSKFTRRCGYKEMASCAHLITNMLRLGQTL